MSFFKFNHFCACVILLLLQSQIFIHFAAAASTGDTGASAQPPANADEWTGWGGNVYNNRWNYKNTRLNSTNIGQVVQNCKLDYPVGVSATPVVLNYTAYYPTANGSFYALNIATCQYEWQVNVTALIYDFQTPSAFVLNYSLPIARTSPQIDGNNLYFGTQALALLVALDIKTGQVLGVTQVNNHPMAVITISPTVYDGKIFSGTSSHEDGAAKLPDYKCCSFIGNFAAYTFDRNARKFNRVWEAKTLPEGQGWAGAGVWGSQPSIDPVRKQVFIGTGNLLVYPSEYNKCAGQPASCLPDNVWQDSVVALDIATGKKNWRQSVTSLDGWNQACGFPGAEKSLSPLCPVGVGPDADFGMAPAFVPASLGDGTTGVDSVIVGQKSGNLFNFNAATGAVQWNISVGADDSGSWLSWGVAVDASKIFYTGINYGLKSWTLKTTGATIKNSAWGSVELKSGKTQWETQVPDGQLAYSPPGVTNDIVLVGQSGSSTAAVSGSVIALAKSNGNVIAKLPVEGVQNSGITTKGGFVMFGTGYAYRNPFNTGSFYVYALRGAIADAIADIAASSRKANSTTTTAASTPSATPAATTNRPNTASSVRDQALMKVSWALGLLAAGFIWFG